MKKIFPFFLLVLLLASCQKDPDMSKLDNDFLVFTNHDKDANSNRSLRSTFRIVYWLSAQARNLSSGQPMKQTILSLRW